MFNRTEFDVAMLRKHAKYADLAKVLRIHVSTLYRKLENNGDFDREQIATIMEFLDVSDPNPIFFEKELAQETKK